jgi:hypothetical protein
MSGTLNGLKVKSNGSVSRDEVEKAMIRTATESGNGWNGTFAMVALALMFIARSLTDVSTAIKTHAMTRHGRER